MLNKRRAKINIDLVFGSLKFRTQTVTPDFIIRNKKIDLTLTFWHCLLKCLPAYLAIDTTPKATYHLKCSKLDLAFEKVGLCITTIEDPTELFTISEPQKSGDCLTLCSSETSFYGF